MYVKVKVAFFKIKHSSAAEAEKDAEAEAIQLPEALEVHELQDGAGTPARAWPRLVITVI